jgi:hypothetical protein
MARNEDIILQEPASSAAGEQETQGPEQDALSLEQAEEREWESHWRRGCVLLGNALLQLPIWGRPSLSSRI